jgi:hypothetical protein
MRPQWVKLETCSLIIFQRPVCLDSRNILHLRHQTVSKTALALSRGLSKKPRLRTFVHDRLAEEKHQVCSTVVTAVGASTIS